MSISCRIISIIVGGSYIAIEFAQMYRRFGSRVTILQRGPRLIAREDDDVSQAMLRTAAQRRHRRALECRNDLASSKRGERHSRERHRRLTSAARGRTHAEHRRSRTRKHIGQARRQGLHRRRRHAAHHRAEHLGDGRLQRPRRLHAHLVQRLRNRRRQCPRHRIAARVGSHRHLRGFHRSAARTRRYDGRGNPQIRQACAGRHARR